MNTQSLYVVGITTRRNCHSILLRTTAKGDYNASAISAYIGKNSFAHDGAKLFFTLSQVVLGTIFSAFQGAFIRRFYLAGMFGHGIGLTCFEYAYVALQKVGLS